MEKEISLNFKRNFPLKADLFKVYSYIKADIFDADPIPKKVIDIKNGWKFLGNAYSNALSESKGMIVFSKKELDSLKGILSYRNDWLKKRNIKFYLAIAPNKHSVYGDMIPIRKNDRNNKLEQIDSLCKTIGVRFINLGTDFPKDENIRLYHKTDSHWNDYAGFYAFGSIMKEITKDFNTTNFNLYTIDDMIIETTNDPIGDLNEMLQLEKNEAFIHFNFKNPEKVYQLDKTLTIRKGYHKDPSFYELRYRNDINDLKIMTMNDSFFGYFRQYIVNNFGNSLLIWDYKFDENLIESEKPDILLHEIAERDVDFLLAK
ncbi:alginate O-acetyltransferase AlgX-related protein [Aquimarina sp. 2304DJ70-9]|uniref:alginate O-acetyltransferase AlgX-related protein n=1 Tax=Aquimarina penaris TaxID=3231044 RepID=UPI0034633913